MRLIGLLMALILTLTAPAMAKAPPPVTAKTIEALVRRHAELEMFSGTVLVAKHDEVIYSGAFGDANKDHRIANRLETAYNIGSIGKTFTAVAIMQLVEAGKLKLDDKLGQHLADFPFAEKDRITIQQLLNHSAGLGNYMEHPEYPNRMARIESIADILPLIYEQKPLFAPGERFEYSNSGMVVLGAIIEKLSGLSYPDYLRRHIFEPAGMRDTRLAQEHEVLPNRAIGYLPSEQGYVANLRMIMPASADGGLRTTAPDLLKFDQALTRGSLLKSEIQQQMYTPVGPAPHYASGWETKALPGHRVVGHGGGAPGVNAEFRRYLDDGYTLIVLSNYEMGASPLAESIERLLLGQPYRLPTAADADLGRAQQLAATGAAKAALPILERLGDAEPPHLPALYQLARLRIVEKLGVEKALPALTRYIELADDAIQPSKAAAWWRKGNAYELLGERSKARTCYETALAQDPNLVEAQKALAALDGAN